MDFERFRLSHGSQLARIPQIYWKALYEKLCVEVYDAGGYFTMSPSEEEGWKVVVSAKDGLKKEDPSAIFLVDHAWTFQPPSARQQLLHIPGLANRMAALMDLTGIPTDMLPEGSDKEGEESYEADSESGNEKEEWSDDDDQACLEKKGVDKSASACDGGGESDGSNLPTVVAKDGYSSGDLGDVSQFYATEVPEEKESDSDTETTPKKDFMERYTLVSKDADESSNQRGKMIQLDKPAVDGDLHVALDATAAAVGKDNDVVNEGLPPQDLPSEELVDRVLNAMWRYCHAYQISNSPVPMWYVMDEFGSRIRQSCDPTMAMVSFFFIPAQLAYSVIWPLKDIQYAEEATCNFLPECVKSELDRACHALPWSHDSHLTLDSPLWEELGMFTIPKPQERCNETIPDPVPSPSERKSHYTVYTDIKLIQTFLTHSAFKITKSESEADILWLSEHFKQFRSMQAGKYINQFPCENVLTCKDLLAVTCRRGKQEGASSSIEERGPTLAPSWLPLTFNLLYELPLFVREYLERKEKREENTWIVKPWNLGRGMDIHISNNLCQIIRLAQAGPKIVSKYIPNPVLFQRDDVVGGVKFDVRYILLLSSVNPIVLHVYDIFWLRFANRPFSLDNFMDYDKHFTVMNYREESRLKQIHCDEFIRLFEQQYPERRWSTVQSRAIYAADLMLEWVDGDTDGEKNVEPRLLEVNFSPDCVRACKYHPDFFNHVFQLLFLHENSHGEALPVTQLI